MKDKNGGRGGGSFGWYHIVRFNFIILLIVMILLIILIL